MKLKQKHLYKILKSTAKNKNEISLWKIYFDYNDKKKKEQKK